MEEEKKAMSIKSQKKFVKQNRIRNNLCEKHGNKKTIGSPVVITNNGVNVSDDDGDEVRESKVCVNF